MRTMEFSVFQKAINASNNKFRADLYLKKVPMTTYQNVIDKKQRALGWLRSHLHSCFYRWCTILLKEQSLQIPIDEQEFRLIIKMLRKDKRETLYHAITTLDLLASLFSNKFFIRLSFDFYPFHLKEENCQFHYFQIFETTSRPSEYSSRCKYYFLTG